MEALEHERYLFVDIETGSLILGSPILEIGMRCEWGETDPSPVEFSVVIKPTELEWARCDERALAVNQFTWEEVQEKGVPLEDAAQQLSSWLLQHNINNTTVTWVGQNGKFDINFLENKLGAYLEFVGIFPVNKRLEVMQLARELKKIDNTFSPISFSGGSISLALGLIPEDNVHRSMGGVHGARQNFYALKKRLETWKQPNVKG